MWGSRLLNFILLNMQIDFKIQAMQPSKNITPQIVIDHFNWRKFNTYSGVSTIQIGDVKEPI